MPQEMIKIRCENCHLTIKKDEIGDGFCPECYEKDGKKRYDFEELVPEKSSEIKYSCEDCGYVVKIMSSSK